MGRERGQLVLAVTIMLLVVVSFLQGYRSASQTVSAAPPAITEEGVDPTAILFEVWQILHTYYVDRATIDDRQLVYGATRGMVEALGDPHTSFSDPRQNALFRQELQGTYDGIGVSVSRQTGRLVVVSVLEGSPAMAAGVLAGDTISAIDGKPTEAMSLADTVSLMRGPRGTTVTVTIERPGIDTPIELSIVRAEIKTEVVRSKMLPGRIAYVKVTGFRQATTGKLRETLVDLLKNEPVGLILDLRDNPGGYLSTSVEVASEFLEYGPVVHEEDSRGRRKTLRVQPGGGAYDIPMVVLVNAGSASASEIVAGALQDTARAVIIGQTTYGKGSVQSVRDLSDGSGLRVTTAWWLTPDGRRIHGQGLDPDIAVEKDTSATPATDRELERAISYLLSLAHPPR